MVFRIAGKNKFKTRLDKLSANEVLTAVSAFDSHCPHVDWKTWGAVTDYTKKNRDKVGVFVFGGDNVDCGSISHHTKGKPIFRPRGGFKAELDLFRSRMLDPIDKILKPGTEKIFFEGNHEFWLRQLLEEQPELEGMLDIASYLELEARGWKFVPQGGHYKRGHLKWIHGDVLTGGQNAPRKALDTYVESIVFGHFHAFASATKVLPHSAKYKWQAWATGCIGRLDASYLKRKPTGWLSGFALTEFYGNSGNFNHFPITVFNGRFAYGGKLYSAKKA
jgi:hypothetical protein